MMKQYLQVTKPGIIFGNLISVIGGFLLASKGSLDVPLFILTMVGVSLVVASGCVFNNYIDRDIDCIMERTKNRALVRGLIAPGVSLWYASALGVAGIALLYFAANPLAALLAVLGFLVYVGVYSLYMKRHSVYGTLVGSLSGAALQLASPALPVTREPAQVFLLAQRTAFPTVPGTKHRIRQQDQPGTDGLVALLATLGDGHEIAGHVGPAQLPLVGVDKPVAGVLVGHQHPVKLGAQQPLGRLLTTAIGRHEADGYLAQRQPHPAALSTPLMPGLIGMNVGGRLHLLLDGLVGRGEHGTHPPLRLTDGAPAKTQAEMLFELLLYLADALVKLAALQRDVAEQIGPHLAAADVVWQCGLGRADTP